jgi:hypothetical protein
MEIAASIMMAEKSATLQSASMSMLKKQHEMEMSLVNMIEQVAKSAPPPGQGTVVDKSA